MRNILRVLKLLNYNVFKVVHLYEGWGVSGRPPLDINKNYIYTVSTELYPTKDEAMSAIHLDSIIVHRGYKIKPMTVKSLLKLNNSELSKLEKRIKPTPDNK